MDIRRSDHSGTKELESEERRDDTYSVRGLDAELDHVIDVDEVDNMNDDSDLLATNFYQTEDARMRPAGANEGAPSESFLDRVGSAQLVNPLQADKAARHKGSQRTSIGVRSRRAADQRQRTMTIYTENMSA